MSVLKLLSPKEIIKRLDISYSTFLRMIKEGIIPSVKIGSQIRVPESFLYKLESEALKSVEEEVLV